MYRKRQSSSALGINKEQRGDGKDHLDGTITQRCIQCLGICVADLGENGRAVERDDWLRSAEISVRRIRSQRTVDAAHLLSKHNS